MSEEFSNNMVSVIMPVYNAAKYLETSLLSIVNQTYKDWELVLVDDCSSDSSPDIIAKIQSQHPNIGSEPRRSRSKKYRSQYSQGQICGFFG